MEQAVHSFKMNLQTEKSKSQDLEKRLQVVYMTCQSCVLRVLGGLEREVVEGGWRVERNADLYSARGVQAGM